jgi:hypothetical protein
VPAVQAVEIPERQHRLVPAWRRIVGVVEGGQGFKGFGEAVTSTTNPS